VYRTLEEVENVLCSAVAADRIACECIFSQYESVQQMGTDGLTLWQARDLTDAVVGAVSDFRNPERDIADGIERRLH
jgi:hypothetical protein